MLAALDELRAAYPWRVASLEEIDYLVTDGEEDLTSAFAAAGARVVEA
jgi:hypothetical protein